MLTQYDLMLWLFGFVWLTAPLFEITRSKYSEKDSSFVDKKATISEKLGLSSAFNSQHLDIISDLNDMMDQLICIDFLHLHA